MGPKLSLKALSAVAILGSFVFASAYAGSSIEEGKKIVQDRKKGNCLACHQIEDGAMPGDIGPPLVGMKDRFPDKKALRAQIWDPTVRNADTPMPPFGRHQILTEDEIDNVVDYIYSL